MAHQWIRANLLSTTVPFLALMWGRTVIADTAGELQSSANSPQVYYMEDVMPTTAGYQSINYSKIFSAPPHVVNAYFYDIFGIKIPGSSTNELRDVYIATGINSAGHLWVNDTGASNAWNLLATPYGGAITPMGITIAYVNGQTYIYMANKGCFHFDPTAGAFVADTLLGLTAANIIGITSANGYMIAYGTNFIAWSSTSNPLDFQPSLVTGAGGGSIGEVKDDIVGCFTISGGFIIYSYSNAVQASYTGNINFPFKFQEVPGSGGVSTNDSVSWQDNSDVHIIYGNKGLQLIQIGEDASQVFPEVTEMLQAGFIETFVNSQFVYKYIPSTTATAAVPLINLVGTRYIVISYDRENRVDGTGEAYTVYTRALVYDNILKRWGKLVFDHIDVIEYFSIDLSINIPNSRDSIGLLDYQGNFYTVLMDLDMAAQPIGSGNSVLLLGKFQLQRNKGVYLQRVSVENVTGTSVANLYVLATLDGKTFQPEVHPTVISVPANSPETQTFGCRIYGQNVSICLTGDFNITSMEVDLVLGAENDG